MKVRDILILVLVIALAIAVALFTGHILRDNASKPQLETVPILVVKRDLNVGDKLAKDHLSWKSWPKDSLHSSYITKKEAAQKKGKGLKTVLGAVARVPLSKGEPIRQDKIIRPKDRSLLAAILAPGKRAFTINLGKKSNVSGLVLPGDFVDVIMAGKPTRGEKASGRTVVSRVRVVATDGKLSQDPKEKVKPPKEISLEVSPFQAERLAAALKEGQPSISVYSLSSLHKKAKASVPDTPKKKEPTQRIISVLRGDTRSSVSLQTEETREKNK